MTPEEVCQMIDTIYEGREYEYKVGDDATVNTDANGVTFFAAAHKSYFDISDPRQAREIAAALVAWADHKEADADGVTSVAAAKFIFEIARARQTQAKSHPEV